ncbi:MAG: hypothetical protein IPK50_05720 [Fibrobacterota bacterium]|nr:hypothetical protein [Fibrobacterota bacterium]QQS06393.1 MAG: hypothetical protein IPK50_05720 [Fibrobacterota bacterium]
MKSSGKTGELLQIKIPSQIMTAGWGEARVAAGGEVAIEVQTHLVADGSPVKLEIKTVGGKTIGTFDGKVYADLHRRKFTVPKDTEEDLVYQAKLSEHKLDKVSNRLVVIPGLAITDTKWLDPDGKELKSLQDGKPAKATAKIQGRPDDTEVDVSVMLTETDGTEAMIQKARVKIKDKSLALKLKWSYGDKSKRVPLRPERDRHAEKYKEPTIHLKAICDGVVALGPKIPLTQEMVLKYQSGEGIAGPFEGKKVTVIAPDGKKSEHTIPADGVVKVGETKPGHYEIEHPKMDEEK